MMFLGWGKTMGTMPRLDSSVFLGLGHMGYPLNLPITTWVFMAPRRRNISEYGTTEGAHVGLKCGSGERGIGMWGL